jgi:flagellar biosynthetic protein FliQ
MSSGSLALLAEQTLYLALRLAAPCLLAVAVAGVCAGLLQAATQAGDPSLGFVTKLAAGAAALFFCHGFISHELMRFMAEVVARIAQVAR